MKKHNLPLARIMMRTLRFVGCFLILPTMCADALAAAALEPKTVRTYSAKHELNAEATRERITWLKQQFKIESK